MKQLFILALLCVMLGTSSYACTGITKTVNGKTLYGANEDWNNPYASIRFIPGHKGEFGIAAFICGDSLGFQGVNETGLAIDYFATPFLENKKTKDKNEYDGDLVLGVLKNCETVNEAIDMLNKYDLSFLNEFHLLITDKNGDSVIFEGDIFHRKENDYQVVTNFLLSQAQANSIGYRYKTADKMLKDSNLEVKAFEEILDKTKQSYLATISTVYSYIYNLNSGDIFLYSMGDFSKSLLLNIHEELEKGDHIINFKELIPNERQDYFLARYKRRKPKEKFLSEDQLKTYVGEYLFTDGTKIEVNLKDGYLIYIDSLGEYKLLPTSSWCFFFEKDDYKVRFNKDNKGKIKSLAVVTDYWQGKAEKVFSFKHMLTNLFN